MLFLFLQVSPDLEKWTTSLSQLFMEPQFENPGAHNVQLSLDWVRKGPSSV